MRRIPLVLVLTFAALLSPALDAAVVEVAVMVREGDTPPAGDGNPVDGLNSPFTNGRGTVGWTGSLDLNPGSDTFVWFGTDLIWRGTDEPAQVLSGGEGTMGISDSAGFIYSPSVDGDDAVWTDNGLLLVEGSPAPGFDPPTTNTFNSRPTMTPGGIAHWIAGYDLDGGGSSDGRVVYRAVDGLPENIEVVLRAGDMVGGFEIEDGSGIDFDYAFSDDGTRHIQPLQMVTGNIANDNFVYVDGALVARESDPTGDGDNWDNFDNVTINDSGNYLFSGDTDGASGSDEFIAYDGLIVLREGDTVDGFTLTSSASVQGVAINNLGQAVHQWDTADGEVLFKSCDASDLRNGSTLVLAEGDEIDSDGDGVGEATITDLNAAGFIGPGLSLAENGRLYVGVDLDDGLSEFEAILQLDLTDVCGTPEPDLVLTGNCPGTIDIDISGGTPNGSAALLRGAAEGNALLPGSGCEGLATGLAGITPVTVLGLDGGGGLQASATAPAAVCGAPLQVIDLESCTASDVVALPE